MRLPHRGRKARWIAILYGLLIFFWLSSEDNRIWPVTLLGAGAAVLIVAWMILSRWGGQTIPARYVPVSLALFGLLTGLGASLITALLMLFKNARHGHIFPDYPPGLMGAILERGPLWALGGALAGLGVGLAWLALQHPEENK